MIEEPKRRGRPPKNHLQENHHFHAAEDIEQPSAPPPADASPEPAAETEAGSAQPSALPQEATAPEPAEPIGEDVVENPTNCTDTIQNADVIGAEQPEPLGLYKESPIEQKIQELLAPIPEASPAPENLNGWFVLPENEAPHVSELPPRNGTPIRVSEDVSGEGIVVQWKKTRAFSNPTKRWVETGVWADFQTGVPITFKPKYWRGRYA